MAVPNNPTVCKVSLVGHRDTREWVNTLHVQKSTGDMLAADLTNIAQEVYTWWHSNYRAAFPPAIVLDQIQVRKLDPSDPLALDYTTGLPEGGSSTLSPGTLEAANVTQTISWRTGLAGKKFRGRIYIPGIMEELTTADDRSTSPENAILAAAASAWLTISQSLGPYKPVIFHVASDLATTITSYVIDAILDSMRRRLPGRGR